jgi:hypothetical protein
MALAAVDASERVEQLITLTERLTALLAEQAAAFEARRPQAAALSAARCEELATLYRRESAQVRANPKLVADAPAARRERLKEVTRAFEATLKRHGRALYAAKTVTEGVMQAIAQEIARKRMPVAGYGPRAKATARDASAITLNRRA